MRVRAVILELAELGKKSVETASRSVNWQWRIQGGIGWGGWGGWGPVIAPSPFLDYFFTKTKFTSKKWVLNEYEICLKMLEEAILETQTFKNF